MHSCWMLLKINLKKIQQMSMVPELGAPWTLMPIMGHHGHVHGAPKPVRCNLVARSL